MKTILVDFDGVIHQYNTPWVDAITISDPPVIGAFEWLGQAVERFNVCIYSSRSKEPGGIEAMKNWLFTHGLGNTILFQLSFPTTKPPAHMTIDDRGFCFEGVFPDLDVIAKFIPWNRR